MAAYMATTMDNPYNPFTHFDEWRAYDVLHHYNTCELVAYFDESSSFMEDEDYEFEVNQAINKLLDFDPFGIHIKVKEETADRIIKVCNEVFNEIERQLVLPK